MICSRRLLRRERRFSANKEQSVRQARSLATIYIFARVRITGALVPFYVIGNSSEFPITIRVSKDTLTFIDFCLYLENLTRIDFRIGYLENLQNASLVFFILIMLSLFGQHNEPSYFHNPIAF